MQLVILAGGKGTRLGLTDIPKPMCPIAGKPLLERQIELARDFGIDEIFILSGHLAHVISDYFGDGSNGASRFIILLNRTRWEPPVACTCLTAG